VSASDEVQAEALQWIGRFAAALGVDAPSEAEVVMLLDLASTAAHASHRQAAPVACWMAARAGIGPLQALEHARALG
jgi:hypothetical protein